MKGYRWLNLLLLALLVVLLAFPIQSFYYQATGGASCKRCHEIRPAWESWKGSTHREITCSACHGGILTADLGFHWNNFQRLLLHWDETVRIPKLSEQDAIGIQKRCQTCHRKENADWQAGPHSPSYARIFLDPDHNRKVPLEDDCLRCHGMYYEKGIRELVTPLNTEGPWRLLESSRVTQATISCLVCHQIHTAGLPHSLVQAASPVSAASRENTCPSLGFYDRRDRLHIAASLLPLPRLFDGERPVMMSLDPRQGLCYQCHAPEWTQQVGSCDDRTCLGVHEGISCLACHQKHTQSVKASCAECHPKMSNCGLDVEKMDTTFANPQSRHNIHFVRCIDCHPEGVPKRKEKS